jgi:hypothetical protein
MEGRTAGPSAALGMTKLKGGFSSSLPLSGWKDRGPRLVIPSEPGFPASLHWTAAACAAFIKESRIKLARATNTSRKSGKPRGLRFTLVEQRNPEAIRSERSFAVP